MATARGGRAARLYIGRMTAELQETILPGAVRAGMKVIAQQAKENIVAGIRVMAQNMDPARAAEAFLETVRRTVSELRH